jgi:GNAT superfamily N-acetyltransferase
MMLKDGHTDVPSGKIAAIVTHLRMLAPSAVDRGGDGTNMSVRRVANPTAAWYRDLYGRVGEDWLWFSRRILPAAALEAIICDPLVEIYSLTFEGRDEGLLELDFRIEGACELAYFGLTPALIGRGGGRLLMNHAIEQAWRMPIRCFWVHTCTFDHPGAVAFYLRSGFHAFKRQIEIADDPRLNGSYPAAAAPHVPVIRA